MSVNFPSQTSSQTSIVDNDIPPPSYLPPKYPVVEETYAKGVDVILSPRQKTEMNYSNNVNSSPVYFSSNTINNSSAIQEQEEKYTKKWSKIEKENNTFDCYLKKLSSDGWEICEEGGFAVPEYGDVVTIEELKIRHDSEKVGIEKKIPLYTSLDEYGFPLFEDLLEELSRNEWVIVAESQFAVSPSGNSLTFDQIKNAVEIAQIRLYTYDAKTGTFKNDYNQMSFEMLVERYYNQSTGDIIS